LAAARSYSILVLLSIIWGIAFVAIRFADRELSPVNLALLRWMIAGAVFLSLIPVFGKAKVKFERRDFPRLLLVSVCNVAGYHISLNYSETIVSSGLAGLLISFAPLFTLILSAIFLREKVDRRISVALGLGILGAVILSVVGQPLSFGYLLGPLAVMLAAFSYSVFSVASKPLVMKYGAFWTAAWAGAIGTTMLLPLASEGFVSQVASMSLYGWSSVLYLSILSTVLGYILFYRLVSSRSVSSLSIQLYLVPLVSVVGGAVLLGESVGVFTVVGGALLLIAVAMVTTRKKER
jgi:drug/metabolite transporter (DMT)-like permease